LIVLNSLNQLSSGLVAELSQYVKNGGNVLVFPAGAADLTSYSNLFNNLQSNNLNAFENTPREVSNLNMEEFIFKDVFSNNNANFKLPSSTGNYRLTNRSGENIMTYRDGSSFLTKNKIGQGHLYLCATSLEDKYSTLARSGEVFVPMLYKMAISSAKEWKIGYTIGKEEFIPEQRIVAAKAILSVKEGIKEAGFYSLFTRPDSALYKFGFNFDRRESVLDYFDNQALKDFTNKNIQLFDETAEANFTAVVGEKNQGVALWRWCVILALLFLAIETLILRFWKI
jgi:Beta-galactosidase trimerisation domain